MYDDLPIFSGYAQWVTYDLLTIINIVYLFTQFILFTHRYESKEEIIDQSFDLYCQKILKQMLVILSLFTFFVVFHPYFLLMHRDRISFTSKSY